MIVVLQVVILFVLAAAVAWVWDDLFRELLATSEDASPWGEAARAVSTSGTAQTTVGVADVPLASSGAALVAVTDGHTADGRHPL